MPSNIDRWPETPKPTILRCPACGQLHLDKSGECLYECDAEMEECEIIAADQLTEAVEAGDALADAVRRAGLVRRAGRGADGADRARGCGVARLRGQ